MQRPETASSFNVPTEFERRAFTSIDQAMKSVPALLQGNTHLSNKLDKDSNFVQFRASVEARFRRDKMITPHDVLDILSKL